MPKVHGHDKLIDPHRKPEHQPVAPPKQKPAVHHKPQAKPTVKPQRPLAPQHKRPIQKASPLGQSPNSRHQ